MKQYHDLLEHILSNGIETTDRTGVGTKSVFGYQMRFDLTKGFPAITTKKLIWKGVVSELLWMLEGSTDERRLAELNYGKPMTELIGKRTIWTDNADKQGKDLGYVNTDSVKELGPVYGAQWRNFNGSKELGMGVDQILNIIHQLKHSPNSRRILLTAWNPNMIDNMALPPCHFAFQLSVRNDRLSGMLTMRSNDVFLGTPFNIASYALFIHILAKEVNMNVGELIYSIGDAHIYLNHIEQVKEQLSRTEYELPTLHIDKEFQLMDRLLNGFELNDVNKFELMQYKYHPAISAKMAV